MNFASLNQLQIDWLLARNVSPWAIIRPAPIMSCRGVRAEDGRFDPDDDGKTFFVFEEEIDWVFWRPGTNELATDEGRAFALGEEMIDNPATCALDQWLKIYADPLEWLRHERKGIVVLRWDFTFDRLRDVPRIAVDEPLLATLRRHMKPRHMPKLAVLPAAERRVAA